MSAIFTIAIRDLKTSFTSLKGMTIFWFFLLIMGFLFQSYVASFVELQQRAPVMGGEAPNLEQLLVALFSGLHFILILSVPAVTMSSFAAENKNQSFRLLQTAPITSTQIVIAKFLAVAIMMGLVLLASSAFPIYTMVYGNPDPSIIFSSYLGLFLLVCSQLALGLWISSLTSNQFSAFLFTMFGLFILMILNWLSKSIAGTGVTGDILKYLASAEHLNMFFKGMITVKDLMYFITFITMFLFLTNISIDSKRWR